MCTGVVTAPDAAIREGWQIRKVRPKGPDYSRPPSPTFPSAATQKAQNGQPARLFLHSAEL